MALVTGVMGFSGAYVARELLSQGVPVLGTDLPGAMESPDRQAIVTGIGLDLDHPKLTLQSSDLLEPSSLEALFDHPIKRVFHVASLYDYSASLEILRRINVQGTRNLLDTVHGRDLERFVHWSTCGVFGKPYTARDGAKVNIPFNEASPSPRNSPHGVDGPSGTHLVNDYSVSKWEQEQMVWAAYRNDGLPLTVIRPAPIYGPGSSYGHGGISLVIAHGLLPAIPRDARNYITASVHVEDVARFAAFIADEPDGIGEDYNVVDNSIISFAEFLQFIALLNGRRIREIPGIRLAMLQPLFVSAAKAWTWLERRLGIPRVRVFEIQSTTYVSSSYWLSNRKTLAAGFEYRYPDVREGLKDTMTWFREHGWLTDKGRLLGG
jgi:dihydroflavonol-4-reductase